MPISDPDEPKTEGRRIRRGVADRKLGAGYFVYHNRDARKPCHAMGGCTSRTCHTLQGAAANTTIRTKDAARGADCQR